ncbi:MAG: hypothetical protein AB7P94_16945 [Steroidobacteraceae bacterium]
MNAPIESTALQVTVQQPTAAALTRGADSALALVEAFEVTDDATFALGGEELQAIKRKATALEEQRKAITKPLDDAKKAVMDLFRGPAELLAKAEGILKGKLLGYQQEQQRKAAEQRRIAEQAAQAERDKIAAEAKRLEDEGRAGEAVVQRAIAEMVVAQPTTVAAAPKVAGLATRTSVEFEVVDLLQLVKHIAQHPELIGLLQADSVKLRSYVRGLGLDTNLPGVRVFEKASLAAARK